MGRLRFTIKQAERSHGGLVARALTLARVAFGKCSVRISSVVAGHERLQCDGVILSHFGASGYWWLNTPVT